MNDHIAGAGQLVTETLDFDGGRGVTVYVPPEPATAAVFMGDGQTTAQWARGLGPRHARTTLIVGVHRCADETHRLHEYSPGFDPARFAAHERFFVEDVAAWTRARFALAFPPRRTVLFGASAGAELALALGHRHPRTYGAVLCASPGAGYQPPGALSSTSPRTYLVAGTEEPFFLANATRWADALRGAGVEVVLSTRTGSHGGEFWQREFPEMIAWALE
jgi:enterochelin esterase-like enzyme